MQSVHCRVGILGEVSAGAGRGEYDGVKAAVCVGGVEVRRIEVAAFLDTEPFQHLLMFGVGGVGKCVDEIGIAVDTTAVFRRTGACTVHTAGVPAAGLGG